MTSDIKSCTRDELVAALKEWGEPAWRADQLLAWLYVQRVSDWEAMRNLPKMLRERLRKRFTLQTLTLARLQGARDTTRKFLWRLPDGALIESVLIPANPALYSEPSDRQTLCISTQVGCAYGCRFCASGLEGWRRNLLPHEIVEQAVAVERWSRPEASPATHPHGPRHPSDHAVHNIVVMGMGEPLANYEHLLRALRILNAPWGLGVGARKITVSTSGLVPEIRRLAEQPLQLRLAISLHGATDETRSRLMPVNRKYPLAALTEACEYYVQQKGQMITLEYILMAGVNDGLKEVKPLAALARRLHAKVNLIPYNRVEGLPWERPEQAVQEKFLSALEREKISVTLRREKGHDIDAACGQLRLKTERELRADSPPVAEAKNP